MICDLIMRHHLLIEPKTKSFGVNQLIARISATSDAQNALCNRVFFRQISWCFVIQFIKGCNPNDLENFYQIHEAGDANCKPFKGMFAKFS